MCCASMKVPNGLDKFFGSAFNLVLAVDSEASIELGLSMLSTLPEEFEDADLGRDLKSEISNIMIGKSEDVLTLMDQLLTNSNSHSTQGGQLRNFNNRQIYANILNLLKNWIPYGITVTKLYLQHKQCFRLICDAFAFKHKDTLLACCSMIQELIPAKEYPATFHRMEGITLLLESIVNVYRSSIEEFTSEVEIIIETCQALTCIASTESAYVVGCDPDEATTVIAPQYRNYSGYATLLQLLLYCMLQQPRSIAFLTFDFWIELQDIPYALRNPYINEQIIPNLFHVLITHCTYPIGAEYWKHNITLTTAMEHEFASPAGWLPFCRCCSVG